MLPNEDLVRRIWAYSSGAYAFQSTKFRGRWEDHCLVVAGDQEWPIQHQPAGHDLYFSALQSKARKRSNDNFLGAAILYADLDPVHPDSLDIRPTIAWETSPGMYQAVWVLDEGIGNYTVWADLNQRMTRHTGADRGGWMGSKALRWPGSLNWKRATESSVPLGKVLWDDGIGYDWMELRDALPKIEVVPDVIEGDHPEPIPNDLVDRSRSLLRRKYWDRLNMRSQSMISRKTVVDRSLFIMKTAHQLVRDGLTHEEAFHLIWVQPWCKWRTDRHAPEVLWSELKKAGR